ncbi:MAG: aspartyl-phosphate phosphatase Spo0E family protein [Dethiobacter sp.]|nr:aspartyl-phosphate phosphatase Spo0E family protein [Dethiobacter sp.]
MIKLECSRTDLLEEIEILRSKLNRQSDFTGSETMRISMELDKLILIVMKENG